MREKYFKMLNELYEIIPAELLTILSRNTAYKDAGDDKTRQIFKSLEFLYTGRMAKRKTTWWDDRHRILKELNKIGIVDEKTMIEYY